MNPFLAKALLPGPGPYFSGLPYNINWFGRRSPRLLELAESCGPVVCADIGCRGGLAAELYPLRSSVFLIGFDADEEACRSLDEGIHPYFERRIFPFFISAEAARVPFHLYKSRAHSSALHPDSRFRNLFSDDSFSVEKTVELPAMNLDGFFALHPELPRPDLIKVDTQGTGLDVLLGARDALLNCSMVEVEVEFLETYRGQKLFPEVMAFMLDQGFELFHLNRVFAQRRGFSGRAKGQLIFGDALFVRREDKLEHFTAEQLLRFITLLINYGYLDVASHLAADSRISTADREKVMHAIAQSNGRWSLQVLRDRINPWIDRLALLLLHLRRHNGLGFDSDRSWPIR